MKRRLTSEQIAELKKLRKSISAGHEATALFVRDARNNASSAIAECLIIGNALARMAQIVGVDELKAELPPGVPLDDATAYMRVAKRSPEQLATPAGLNRAFMDLGIIEKRKGTTDGPPN